MRTLVLLLLTLAALPASAEQYTVAVLPKGNYEYWRIVRAGTIRAQQELEREGVQVRLLWEHPKDQNDADAQLKIMERLMKEKVSGFVAAPINSATFAPAVEAAAAARVPTVIIDSSLRSSAHVAYVATENFNSGAIAARTIGKMIEGKGRVIVFRYQKGASSSDARVTNFLTVLKSLYPEIQVDAEQYTATSVESAKQVGLELVQQCNREATGVFCSNGPTTMGLISALQANQQPRKMKVLGFDAIPGNVAALKKAQIDGLLVQNPEKMGYLGVRTLMAHLRGQPFERTINTECILVTPETVNSPNLASLVDPPMAPP